MGKIMLAGVCSCALCVVTQAFAVPFPFAGTTYQQDFNGLSWSTSTSTSSFGKNFGQSGSSTIGWAVSTSHNYSMTNYNYRQSTFTSGDSYTSGASYSGAPIVPGGATPLLDKSFTIASTGTCYIGVCLANTTGQTISSADIGYTLELWTTPTGPLSGAVVEYDVGQHAFAPNSIALWSDFAAEGTIDTFSFAVGQAPGTELVRSLTLSNLDWQPEQTLVVRWTLPATKPNNQIVGVDDFMIAVPEPSSMLMASGVILATLSRRQRSRK